MHPNASRTLALALLLTLLVVATGCSSGGSAASATPTITSEPTATTATATTPVSGPITTPTAGSAVRAALLKAISIGLGTSGKLAVYQLFVQDGSAVGDVQPSGGSRAFVALTGGPGSWNVAWSAPFGSTLANASSLQGAGSGAFTGLAASIDFTKKVPKPAAKPAAPTRASFEAFALKSAKSFAGTAYTGDFTIQAKIAKDSTGAWWGNAIAEPSDAAGLEAIGVWAHYSAGTWTGEIADFSTEGADAGYFPSDVLAKLAL